MSIPSKSRRELAHAIRNAETAAAELARAREAVADVRERLRQAQLEADRAGVAFEQTRTGTSADGELLERGAVRAARDCLVDAEDHAESLRSALARIGRDIEKQESHEVFAKDKIRECVGMVLVEERLDAMISDYKALQTRHAEAREVLRTVGAVVDRETWLRIEHAFAEPPPQLNAPVPVLVQAWRGAIDGLGKDAATELPKV
jgi:hypothetical protein